GRGGGSNEDLAAFNSEVVATAIFQSAAPVISAVGHEIDVTIADLVADRRALTPSEAAELATPDRHHLEKTLHSQLLRLKTLAALRMRGARHMIEALAARRVLQAPLERLRDHERRLDDLSGRLVRGVRQRLDTAQQMLQNRAAQLDSLSPLNV